jgi:hypothetical protein
MLLRTCSGNQCRTRSLTHKTTDGISKLKACFRGGTGGFRL